MYLNKKHYFDYISHCLNRMDFYKAFASFSVRTCESDIFRSRFWLCIGLGGNIIGRVCVFFFSLLLYNSVVFGDVSG